jgi:hypothetical protein
VESANLNAFLPEQIAQQPAAGKRIKQMQFVYPPHYRQVSARHGPRQMVDAAAADPELPRLSD